MKEKACRWAPCGCFVALLLVLAMPQGANAAVTVKTVPVDPSNPAARHTTYPLDASHEVTIILGATVDLGGSTDSFTYQWDFGDSVTQAAAAITNPYDISAQHQYPFGAAVGTTWDAVVTVKDTTNPATYTATYLVIQEANNLPSRVNVAIDSGLWYLHQNMWRCTNGSSANCFMGGVYGTNGVYGGWDDSLGVAYGFPASPFCSGPGASIVCDPSYYSEAIDASNIQAFEVNGHLENGPSSDPYTEDVARVLARIFMMIGKAAVASKSYDYNLPPSCPNGATTPCSFTFDGNSNGQMLFANQNYYGYPFYQGGQLIDAIVATGTPSATTHTGIAASLGLPGVMGLSYKDVVQDMVDGYNYCQYNHNVGGNAGGAWWYYCPETGGGSYNDNSVSQWGAIGEIGANRAFGIATPSIITDASNLWLTNSQNAAGYFGYNSSNALGAPWGTFADTPSGMVQLTMDGKGRGDSRWDMAETYYHDNFCNALTSGAASSPRAYTYGMFSFTKAMLLHSPGGVLTPITFLQDRPAGTNGIDWYNAVGPESGGSDSCDGVAQTLIKRQGGGAGVAGSPNPSDPQGGYWSGHNAFYAQNYYETGWTIIMLRKTVFVSCVSDLVGKGTPSGRAPATIHLTWTGIPGAVSYNVLRGTASGGPYTQVGNATLPVFSDTTGLLNGATYYYVLQPLNNTGGAMCQSNQATITIPAQAR